MSNSIRRFGTCLLACAMVACAPVVRAAEYTYNKIVYSTDDTIVPGTWSSRYAKAKSYADSKNIPLVVVWANNGCGYCRTLEGTLGGSADFAAWQKKRGYVMVFVVGNTDTTKTGMIASDVSSAFSFARNLNHTLNAYPFVAVYWKKNSSGKTVKANFVGRTSFKDPSTNTDMAMPIKTGTWAQRFMNSVDSYVGDFDESIDVAPTLSVNGATVSNTDAGTVTTNRIFRGVQLDWPISSTGFYETVTMTARSLPSGLKLVKDKTTGVYSIAGVPTVASGTNARTGLVKPTVAKIVATTSSKVQQTFPIAFVVESLPAWATGTYNGGGDEGQATATISGAGKLSGKYLANGKTWTLTASAYQTFSEEEGGTFEVVAKNGRTAVTNAVEVVPLVKSDETLGTLVCESFTAYQNLWKVEPRKTFAKTADKAPSLTWTVTDAEGHEGTLTLSFTSGGAARVKAVFAMGENANGRAIKYTTSAAVTLCAQGGDAYSVFVYLPPRTGRFTGYVERVDLLWMEKLGTFAREEEK